MMKRDPRRFPRHGPSGRAQRTALQQASLALHRPGLSPTEVVGRLERAVVELGLACDARFVWHATGEGAADGVAVRHPDGSLAGVLACSSKDGGTDGIRLLAAHAGAALATATTLLDVERREASIRQVAERLQDALLPELPELRNTFAAVAYRAATREARVGGDFYDVLPLPSGAVLLVVGDVVGKGIEAAVHTSRITHTLRALALAGLDLAALLEEADHQIHWQDHDLMATVWCGVYEPDTGELAFASFGHPPALLLRGDAEPIRLELEGLPLGMRDLADGQPEIRTRRLDPGDLLVLYTDGVVEAHKDYLAGQDALLEAVSTRRDEPIEVILSGALDELLAGGGHRDDAVMLLLRRAETPAVGTA